MTAGAQIAVAIVKVFLGTAFYIVLILVARLFPTAAGMMLTFPALNGLALAAAPTKENVEGAVRTMLLMPALNCLLCAIYVLAFLWLRPAGALVGLIFALGFLWAVITGSFVYKSVGISGRANQTYYILVCSVVFLTLLLALYCYQPPRGSAVFAHAPWWEFLGQNAGRIVLFAVCLSAVVAISDGLSRRFSSSLISRLLGALGGFPLVPLFGLYTVAAANGNALSHRVEIFGSLAVSVWIGPMIAFGFVMSFAAALIRLDLYGRHSSWARRFALAVPFWAACFAAIALAVLLLD